MENKVDKKSISVVGYPKSGNTWLTRLIARSLKISVDRYTDTEEHPEIAADVNKKIESTEINSYVRKIHMYPEEFEKKIQDSRYIVYIKRDPKAVFISSFFYFKYSGEVKYVWKKVNFLNLFRWIKTRYLLAQFLNEFVTKGISPFGKCNEHIDAWINYAESSDIELYIIDYNDLLENTEEVLKNTFDYFNIPYSASEITLSVQQEKFDTRKKEIELEDDGEMTFGKEFNKKFLRAGTKDDWKTYLTDKQAEVLNAMKG